jgi:anti-sigma factor RsiW
MTDQWTDRLSEYLDGELPAAEAEALEAHLMSCADCGRTLQELKLVVTRAGQVIDREPAQDLWAGIATRIAQRAPETEVAVPNKRRFSFSVPQLAAASVVLMLMSAGTMYLMVKSDAAAPVVATTQTPANRTPAAVRTVTNNYDAAVDQLEAVLQNNRDQLDTATVRVIEQNLAIIDRAILEARTALGQEPANPYLTKYLDEAMQRKVQLLRRATSVMRAQT